MVRKSIDFSQSLLSFQARTPPATAQSKGEGGGRIPSHTGSSRPDYSTQNQSLAKSNSMLMSRISEMEHRINELVSENSRLKKTCPITEETVTSIEQTVLAKMADILDCLKQVRSKTGLAHNPHLDSMDIFSQATTSTPLDRSAEFNNDPKSFDLDSDIFELDTNQNYRRVHMDADDTFIEENSDPIRNNMLSTIVDDSNESVDRELENVLEEQKKEKPRNRNKGCEEQKKEKPRNRNQGYEEHPNKEEQPMNEHMTPNDSILEHDSRNGLKIAMKVEPDKKHEEFTIFKDTPAKEPRRTRARTREKRKPLVQVHSNVHKKRKETSERRNESVFDFEREFVDRA